MDELKSKVNKIIVKPFSPNLGSIITGVDLSKNISDLEFSVIKMLF